MTWRWIKNLLTSPDIHYTKETPIDELPYLNIFKIVGTHDTNKVDVVMKEDSILLNNLKKKYFGTVGT